MDSSRFQYHLELRPAQLRVLTETLLEVRERLGPEQDSKRAVIDEIVEKLPDPGSMRSVQIEPHSGGRGGDDPPTPPTPLRPLKPEPERDPDPDGGDDPGPSPGPSAA